MSEDVIARVARGWDEAERSAIGAGRAFPNRGPRGSFFRERILRAPSLPLDNTLLLFYRGDLVSSLQIYERQVTINDRAVWAGAIGNMYTLPPYRGRGYGTRLLQYAREFIQEKGYVLSILLSEKHEFYGGAGWEVLPFVRLRCPDPSQLETVSAGTWENFDPEQHLDRVRDIYRTELRPRGGRLNRPESLWTDWILSPGKEVISEDQILVYREDDVIKGYLVWDRTETGAACLEVAYAESDAAGFRTSAWNVVAEKSESSILWEPASDGPSEALEASQIPIEREEQRYCMVQLHDGDALSAVADDTIDTTGDLIELIANDEHWYWSSVDHI